jgi:folate-binding protein YgfZ
MTISLPRDSAETTREIAGRAITLRYSAVADEYGALQRGAALFDRSHRARIVFEGDKRGDTLTGLVTNDVGALAPGSGCYAAALTPRGKIIADVRIFARDSDLLVDVPVRAAAGWIGMIRKFVNPRTTRYADRTETLADIGVFGPDSRRIVASLSGVSAETLAALGAYGHVAGVVDEHAVTVARAPDIGIDGYELIMPAELRTVAWQRVVELGAQPSGLDAWEIARIEAGRPEWGVDIDESTIPQEANLDGLHAISYTKGCYTGQETVARVHFRGHVNRYLRGLTFSSDAAITTGAQLVDEAEKIVGDVRSTAISPRLGGIALAMVRREVAIGSAIRARSDANEVPVTVAELPFSNDD